MVLPIAADSILLSITKRLKRTGFSRLYHTAGFEFLVAISEQEINEVFK
jgi:hypothetical protein